MRKTKKVLGLLLSVCMLMSLVPTLASAWAEKDLFVVDGIQYRVKADLTKVMVKSADNTITGTVTIPATVTYEGTTFTVDEIGFEAFMNRSDITDVKLPSTVWRISREAFRGTGLTNWEMPDTVTELGSYRQFYECKNLETIKLSKNLTGTMQLCFEYCENLKTCVVPEGVTTLDRTFLNCKNIETVYIPASVTTIATDKGQLFNNAGMRPSNFVVLGEAGSAIATYMNSKSWPFKAVDADMTLAVKTPEAAGETVSLDVVNKGKVDVADDLNVFCAYYSKEDNTLVDIGIAELAGIDALSVEKVTVDMYKTYDAEKYTVKAFVWGAGTLAPFAGVATRN